MKIPSSGAQPIEELLTRIQTLDFGESLPSDQHPFLEVRVQEDGPDPTRRARIEQALEGKEVRLASIKLERSVDGCRTNEAGEALEAGSLKNVQPLEVFMGAWREKYASDPDPAVVEAFREILLQESHS